MTFEKTTVSLRWLVLRYNRINRRLDNRNK